MRGQAPPRESYNISSTKQLACCTHQNVLAILAHLEQGDFWYSDFARLNSFRAKSQIWDVNSGGVNISWPSFVRPVLFLGRMGEWHKVPSSLHLFSNICLANSFRNSIWGVAGRLQARAFVLLALTSDKLRKKVNYRCSQHSVLHVSSKPMGSCLLLL